MPYKINFYLVGFRPVKLVKEFENSPEVVLVFDWMTGQFIEDDSFHKEIYYGSDTVEISKKEFDENVKSICREKKLT